MSRRTGLNNDEWLRIHEDIRADFDDSQMHSLPGGGSSCLRILRPWLFGLNISCHKKALLAVPWLSPVLRVPLNRRLSTSYPNIVDIVRGAAELGVFAYVGGGGGGGGGSVGVHVVDGDHVIGTAEHP